MSLILISIVDDDERVRDATKTLVRSLGYHASAFASADEFLKSRLASIPHPQRRQARGLAGRAIEQDRASRSYS
jgi:hypothetical protein